jgi:hypothetical protein
MIEDIDFSLNRFGKALLAVTAILLFFGTAPVTRLYAQTATATLSGNIVDPSGARIPGAELTLSSDTTKDTRVTVSNGEGVFHFAALPAGSYTLLAKRNGFTTTEVKEIVLHPTDNQSLNVMLRLGAVETKVEVKADDEVPNSGEKSQLISARDIEQLSVQGRDVSELVSMLPGFAIVAPYGLTNGTYDPGQVTTSGGLGNFVANGAPNGGVSISANGVDVTDPTAGGGTTQNINQEMVQEVKVQTSAFSADQAKGPIVLSAITKSGGTEYHGSVYGYARSHLLDTQNWFSKNQGLPDAKDRYLYPGLNFGGPVKLPFSDFNRSKRLTFFVGAEDYVQRNVYAYGSALQSSVLALVPTASMRAGDFSAASLANYLGVNPGDCPAQFVHICGVPTGITNTGMTVVNGNLAGGMDPGALALINALPLPNRATVNGFNYATTNFENNDLWELDSKIDDAATDNLKMSLSYSVEGGRITGIPETQYYSPANGGPSMGGVDTPGKSFTRILTQSMSFNATYILSPTMTNEAFASANLNRNDFNLQNPGLLQASNLGYTYSGIYPNATTQIPQFGDYSFDGLPIALYPDTSNGPFFQHTFTPAFGDNVTKIFGAHTIKVGAFVQRTTSNVTLQTPQTSGLITQYYLPNGGKITNPDGTYSNTLQASPAANYLADFLIGDITQFFQQNLQTNLNLYYWTADFFGQDSWKVSRRLTLTLGMRFDHLGPWQDSHNNGIAIFSPEIYANPVSQMLPGLDWHGIDSSVPNSGTHGRPFFFSPRFGIAYDLSGNGSSVIRGGFGAYRSHDPGNSYAQAAATAQGVFISTAGGSGINLTKLAKGTTSLADCTNDALPNGQSKCPSLNATVYGLDPNDDQQPLTYTYNLTLTQRLPKKTVFQVGYVGSQSHHLLLEGNLQNVDALPIGSLFAPDPLTGTFAYPASLSIAQQGDYRPYRPYTAVEVPRHLSYSYYNGLQAALTRTSGAVTYGANYTWSKNLGIRNVNGQPGDPIYLRNNYGPLNSDRSHVVNVTYSFNFGTHHFAGHKMLGLLANGWNASGITSFQSGPNLQAIYALNLKTKGNVTDPGTTTTYSVNNTTYLGTPDVSLQPTVSCDPTANLQQYQYVNGNCFTLPQIGTVNGSFNFPYIHGPAFFNSDLTLFKNFRMKEGRSLQLRFAGFNFLNHPITSFSGRFPVEANLTWTGTTTAPQLAAPATTSCSVIGSQCFGYAGYKQGRRVVEIAVKYSF